MLSDTLQSTGTVETLKVLLNDFQLTQLLGLLATYDSGMWLYPGVIKRKLELTSKMTYEILREIELKHLIKGYYELYCSRCQKSNGTIVESINKMPETFYCELCNVELPSMENAVMIYKVI